MSSAASTFEMLPPDDMLDVTPLKPENYRLGSRIALDVQGRPPGHLGALRGVGDSVRGRKK